MTKDQVLAELKLFSLGTDGIGGWIRGDADERIFERLGRIDEEALTKVQLNQLLAFGHEAPVSDDFFRYYWFEKPSEHPYNVSQLPDFVSTAPTAKGISSVRHLKWGLYRLFVDALLYFGNVRTAYRSLRALSQADLRAFYGRRRFDTGLIQNRGPALPLEFISKDDRHLISEMACKSYGDDPESQGELKQALIEAYKAAKSASRKAVTFRELIGENLERKYAERQEEFIFSATDVLDETVSSEEDLVSKYGKVAKRFAAAHALALKNTDYYLSMVNDLDVYVATSMRKREDFRKMADDCEKIFSDRRLADLQLRYFDPTMSAAKSHEDKGVVECLMVKCAKALVYCAGEKESYGKHAEAAMALSLGKPVIFYCDQERRKRFYRDVHPLSRLIEFQTGVVVGAMVTDSLDEVTELLYRIFQNKMEYRLEQPKPGYLKLKENLTGSVVRLQTNDRMLTETFWNHYHSREPALR
ncbi:MAG TPA: hypothetical protein VEF03_02770 [Candidatus Binataceae bacterium]|nr:hypothetical protein [Candidatus Binataceae bacterium]